MSNACRALRGWMPLEEEQEHFQGALKVQEHIRARWSLVVQHARPHLRFVTAAGHSTKAPT